MRSRLTLAVNLAVTACVALPIASVACKSVLAFTDRHSPLTEIPVQIGNWQKSEQSKGIESSDILQRIYEDKNNNIAIVVARADGHDLLICLEVNDYKPEPLENVTVHTQRGTIEGSLLKYHSEKYGPMLSLMWYQHGANTAANRWRLRLTNMFSGASPDRYKQFRVAVPSGPDREMNMRQLESLASSIYAVSL